MAALHALLEAARAEQAGRFNNHLFARTLTTVLRSVNVTPEVVAVLVSKYLGYADVRYYTLRVIAREAALHQREGRGQAAGAASDDEEEAGRHAGGRSDCQVLGTLCSVSSSHYRDGDHA